MPRTFLVSEWVAFETSAAQSSNRVPSVHTFIWTVPSRATWSTQQPTVSEPRNTGTRLVSMTAVRRNTTVTWLSNYRRGIGLVIEFIEHLHSWLQITTTVSLSYSKITVTTAHINKVFSVFTSRYLVAAFNGGRSDPLGFRNVPGLSYQFFTSHNGSSQLTQQVTDWLDGLRQNSDSWFRMPRDPWPYLTVWRLWEPSDHSVCPQQQLKVRVRVKITLRLAAYRQPLRLGAKPLETPTRVFFFN
jgi:hypothetical protein